MLRKIINATDVTIVGLFQPYTDQFSAKTHTSNFILAEILSLLALVPWILVIYLRGTRGWMLGAELVVIAAGVTYFVDQCKRLESARAQAFTMGRIVNKWQNLFPYGTIRIVFVLIAGIFFGRLLTGSTPDAPLMAICKALTSVLFASALCTIATRTLPSLQPPETKRK